MDDYSHNNTSSIINTNTNNMVQTHVQDGTTIRVFVYTYLTINVIMLFYFTLNSTLNFAAITKKKQQQRLHQRLMLLAKQI